MAIERVESLPPRHRFTVEEYLAFEKASEFKHEYIDGVIYDWGDPRPGAPVHPDYVPGYPMPHLFTVEEYLAFEARSEFKHEYIDGVIYDMTGGTFHHSGIKVNITVELGIQLRNRNYFVCNSDMSVRVGAGRFVYPDVSVVRGQPELEDDDTTLLNPILTAEVLSPTTQDYDRSTKLRYYQALPSLQCCLIVEQFDMQVDAYFRVDDNWRHQRYNSSNDIIALPMLDCQLPLAEIYRGISFQSA